MANWQLENDQSSLNFISTKNQHVSENHRFLKLAGALNNKGQLEVQVDLSSVETNIPIRNQRMQTHLFTVESAPQATLLSQVPESILSMPAGTTRNVVLQAEISINGISAMYPVQVSISKNNKNGFVASSTQAILIQAGQHGLVSGIEKLQELAGLASIGFTVPVTFSVLFSKV